MHDVGIPRNLSSNACSLFAAASRRIGSLTQVSSTPALVICWTDPYLYSAFKSPELALTIFQTVVTRILPLRQSDLELWQIDPEDFALKEEAEQDSSQWKFDLRPAAETVLQDLMSDATDDAYNAITVPWLTQALQSARQSTHQIHEISPSAYVRSQAITLTCSRCCGKRRSMSLVESSPPLCATL